MSSSSESDDTKSSTSFVKINSNNILGNPTVKPAINIDPIKDALQLFNAFKNYEKESNKDLVVDIFCRRSLEQRLLFIQEYYKTHGNLIAEIKQKVETDLQILLITLLMPISQLNLDYLHEAFKIRDLDTVSDIIFTMSNNEIIELKQNYEQKYGTTLESYISAKTSQHFQKLLLRVCSAARDESGKIDLEAVQRDVKELITPSNGNDIETTFTEIFATRSYQQIKLICDEFLRASGETIEQSIKARFVMEDKQGYLCISRYSMDKYEFYAKRLHRSMAGIGTNDNQLIRIIVTRAEIDLEDIKYAFARKFGKSLRTWIKGDTSGHYKYCLYGLIGEKRSGK